MRFRVTMKDPDTLHDAIQDAVTASVEAMDNIVDPDEKEALEETRKEAIQKICNSWFKYGEYLTVEIDTEAVTCVVVPTK